MARWKFQGTTKDQSGRILPSATISVYLAGTTTPASVYTSVTSTTAVNSITSSSPDATYAFYTDSFDYDHDQAFKIIITKPSYTSVTYDNLPHGEVVLGTYTISTAKIVTTYVKVPKGVVYAKSGSGSLTFNGGFEAGSYQVFSDDLTVSGLKVIKAEWFGVGTIADGFTDSLIALQSALNAIDQYNGPILEIRDTGGSLINLSSIVDVPPKHGVKIKGAGRRNTIISCSGSSSSLLNIDASATVHGANGVQIEGLDLQGAGTPSSSAYGIKLFRVNRSQIRDCRIENFAGNAGIFNTNCIIMWIENVEFDGNKDGIYGPVHTESSPNAWSITNCFFENQSRYALNWYGTFGFNFTGNTVESNHGGGLLITTSAGGINISGNYFEANYTEATGEGFDIYLGSLSYISGPEVHGNYFDGGNGANYYPITTKYASGAHIHSNTISNYTHFINFVSGGNWNSCVFGPNNYRQGFTGGPKEAYNGLPANFLVNGNKIKDFAMIPTFPINFLKEDIISGTWASSLGGGSIFVRCPDTGTVPTEHQGRPVGLLRRVGSGPAAIAKTITVSPTQNSEFRGRFATFAIDSYVNSAVNINFDMILDDAGAQGATVVYSGDTSYGWVTNYVSTYFDDTTTAIRVVLTANSAADYWFANPRLYVGMDPDQMQGISGTPVFTGSDVPSAGTWAVGDRVWNSAAAGGSTPGWVCVTAGTPGTWKAMANLAA